MHTHRYLSWLACLWLGLSTLGALAISAGPFAGGDGTASSPYQIASPEQLVALGSDPNLWDKHFVLIRDLDLVNVDPNSIKPIGNCEGTPFVGVFDGAGHVITHLRMVRPDEIWTGLFGQIGEGLIGPKAEGHVRNLHLRDIKIHGKNVVGGLAGQLSAGTMRNCSVTGAITGRRMVGGLVGWAEGQIDTCTVTGQVHGEQTVGGLVGSADGAIDSCVTAVDVRGTEAIGGLVGIMGSGQGVWRSCSSGRVQGKSRIGGLIGTWASESFAGGIEVSSATYGDRKPTRIIRCRSDCSVSGADAVGGLIGVNYGIGEIQDCYALGPVAGQTKVGGLVGTRIGCCVVRCFAAGRVTGAEHVGALIGTSESVKDANGLEDYPPCQRILQEVSEAGSSGRAPRSRLIYRPAILACFWDAEASATGRPVGSGGDDEGITSLTTDQLRQAAPFRNQGWDFQHTWLIQPGNRYPRLQWEQLPQHTSH